MSIDENDIVYRLRKRAEIRRSIPTRKSVAAGEPDRIADLLEEAAAKIEALEMAASNQRILELSIKSNLAAAEKQVSIARQAAEGLQPAVDIYYIGLFQEQMRMRKAAEVVAASCEKVVEAARRFMKFSGGPWGIGAALMGHDHAEALFLDSHWEKP